MDIDLTHYLRAVLDSTRDAIAAFDESGTFALCNPRLESLLGISAAQLAGRDESWLRHHLEPRIEPTDTFLSPSPESDGKQEDTVRFIRDNGAGPMVLNWYSGPVRDDRGFTVGRIVVLRDTTRESEVDRMKTDFVSIVSHELRTPMTSIRGYVDLILDGDTGDITDLQREFLETVQRNTLRLTNMVNDLLDIARIEEGGLELDIRPTLLNGLVRQSVKEARPQLEAKTLSLNVLHLPPASEQGVKVLADNDRLLQVFTNLLSNAIKYTPSPPASRGQIEIEIAQEEGRARIAVRDTGLGITAAEKEQLFQKFFRSNRPETRAVDGSGLGLSIAHSLVSGMGGELKVDSVPGEGSTFWFTLPLAPA